MSAVQERYKGVFPAFYACYDDSGDISPQRIEAYTEWLINKGVNGLYVGGSSGECIYQTIEERKKVVEAVMHVAKGKIPIIAHVGAPSTRHSIELAEHAQKCGVEAVASIPPIYFVLPEDAIYDYWTSIANASSCDFIIYNIPSTTQYALSLNLFNRMIKHERVVGIKNSSMPVFDIQKFKVAAQKDFVIFNGPDEQFIAGRVMGANAGIGGTYGVMPELFLKADALVREQKMDEALLLQTAINDIITTAQKAKGSLYAVFKAVLALNDMCIGDVRGPLASVTNEDGEIVRLVNQKINFAKEKFL